MPKKVAKWLAALALCAVLWPPGARSQSDAEWQNHAMQAAFIFNKPGGRRFCENHSGSFEEFLAVLTDSPYGETSLDTTLGREVVADRRG